MIHLDDMLDADSAAKWLRLSKRELFAKSRGRGAPITAFRMSRKSVRFNPRTIIAKMARDAGVPESLIAASLNLKEAK